MIEKEGFMKYILKFTDTCVYCGIFIREVMILIWNVPDIQMTRKCSIVLVPIIFFDLFAVVRKTDQIKKGLAEIFWHLLIMFYWICFLLEKDIEGFYLARIWLVFMIIAMLIYIFWKGGNRKSLEKEKDKRGSM